MIREIIGRMGIARRAVLLLASFLVLLLLVSPGVAQDTIRMKNGSVFKGRIVEEDAKSVTVELSIGGRVTFEKREIEEVLRDTGEAAPEEGQPKVSGVLKKEFSFLWMDRNRIGTRSLIVSKLEKGGLRLEEETVFTDEEGKEAARIRLVERATDTFEPLEIIYRETSGEDAQLLHGVVRKGVLELRLSLPGQRKTSRLTLPEGVRFPLAAQEEAVRGREGLDRREVPVFDPSAVNFVPHTFEGGGKRREDWEGEVVEVTVIRRIRPKRGAEEIWIDARGRCLIQQVNGPRLIAVLSTEKRVEAFRKGSEVAASPEEEKVRPEYVHAEAGFRFRKPSLSWTFSRPDRSDRKVLTMENLRYFAYVEISVLPEVPEGGLLTALAVAMEKRFAGRSKEFEKVSQGYREVGGERACQIVARSKNKGEEIQSLLVGLVHRKRTWYVAMACPRRYFPAALPEFEKILDTFVFID